MNARDLAQMLHVERCKRHVVIEEQSHVILVRPIERGSEGDAPSERNVGHPLDFHNVKPRGLD
jgi:hypothetical protein